MGRVKLNNPLEEALIKKKTLVLDGALATELEARGCDLNNDLWSASAVIEKPELIKEIYMDYLKAGADIITGASYQASIEGFVKRGLSNAEAVQMVIKSVRLAVEARDEFYNSLDNKERRIKPLVVASIGPYGAYMADGSEYTGNYSIIESDFRSFHRERISILVSANPDMLACETIPSFREAKAILIALKSFARFSTWMSFSCKDGAHTNSGDLISDCAQWLDDKPQVAAIGINCTDPKHILSLINEVKASTSKPIIVYPNSGETFDKKTKKWKGSPVSLADYVEEWVDAGARIIGGCCRTNPADIKAIADRLKKIKRR